jgi:hypothetical protein
MTEFNLAPDEQMEIIGPDYALAYSALARRVSAVNALMHNGCWVGPSVHKEIEEAMRVIKQVETPILIIPSNKEAS